MTTPRLSVAMAARNAERHIGEALHSVEAALGSGGLSYEIVLADGASSDNTLAIASAHPRVRLVSTRDAGLYDGMNRAIAGAQGTFVVILNSDDLLMPNALAHAVAALEDDASAAMVSGDVLMGTSLTAATRFTHDRRATMEGLLFGIPAINARVYRTAALHAAGPIRGELGLGADREILMRLFAKGARGVTCAEPFYFYRSHEGSATIANDAAARTRIYGSDDTLIRALRAEALYAKHDAVLRAFDALTGLKMKRLGLPRAEAARVRAPGMRDLARGLFLNRKWRGVLSGY